ncbi:MAG: glycosyltransferase family 39 protein [Chloroflexi bacterium]|nr:glycosyltransferase family 39 protein [Chloroflexota bacterium]
MLKSGARCAGVREPWLVLLVVAGIVLVYAWSGHFWVDLVDEGYFLDLSQRVLNGALPYRDFTTYYTPGIFYLFAAAFKLFGANLLVIRYLMAVIRGLCALLLYALTRRVAPWPLAWLPVTFVFLFDAWPIEPEPHPSWPSLVACLLTMEFLVRHLTTRRLYWLALAGASAGVAYFFKQNIGAFTAIGVGSYVLLRPRTSTSLWLRAAQVGFVVATAVLITIVMHEGLDPLTFGGLWLPMMVILGLLLYRAIRGSSETDGSVVLDTVVSAGSFSLVTTAWLIPLLIALGVRQTPLGLFVGEVDQASIATAFAAVTPGIPPLLLTAIWAAAVVITPRARRWWGLAVALGLTAMVLALPIWQGPRDVLTTDPLLQPILGWLDVNFGTLCLYLPSMAVWAGIGGLLAFGTRLTPHPYFVLFGGLTSLTLYPRVDVLHAIVSSPVALIGATGTLALIYARFSGWRRTVLIATGVLLPIVAVAPQVAWRVATVVSPDTTGERLDYEPLGIADAPVLVPRPSAADMHDAVAFIDANTPPGTPLFVYPVAPLFNFLADRPNPTRFDHFLPGTLSDQDFEQVIGDLQHARPRYVLWDDLGVHLWLTDPDNRPLSDYIWSCYHQVTAFHPYLVLERNADAC